MEDEAFPARETFGHLPDGRMVERLTLRAGPVTARVITYGAALQALLTPDRAGVIDDIVLGHDDLAGYLAHRGFFGATIGRVANRIAGARFTLDGREIRLPANDGPNTLHGGPEGFDRRLWQVDRATPERIALSLDSPDGDQGFPGRVTARALYTLEPIRHGAVLTIRLEAETDAPTPVALTHHSFFALPGAAALPGHRHSALDCRLTIPAARYLPVDAKAIPLDPAPVGATPFDFREGRQPATAMRSRSLEGYDHCLCLDGGPVLAEDPLSGRRLQLDTEEPGLQLYTGNILDGSVTGKRGHAYRAHDAFCLEPQLWPDAVNRPEGWCGRPAILRPGTPRVTTIRLRLTAD
ncbi:aldose epimerase family protein [Frigidibacter sp. MR17.14]|uniref:aldose epimerase family protein n=1 Tax=Frigidibacter sp. MR17.14 TaxID=3126509 RepID=UPI003012FEB5